jgi:hypothetical protein
MQFLRLKPYETAFLKVAVPKLEVLEQPQLHFPPRRHYDYCTHNFLCLQCRFVPAITKRALGAVKIYTHVPHGMECPAAKFTGILRFFASFIKLVFMPHVSCRIFLTSIYNEVPHIGKLHAAPFAVHTAHKTPP